MSSGWTSVSTRLQLVCNVEERFFLLFPLHSLMRPLKVQAQGLWADGSQPTCVFVWWTDPVVMLWGSPSRPSCLHLALSISPAAPGGMDDDLSRMPVWYCVCVCVVEFILIETDVNVLLRSSGVITFSSRRALVLMNKVNVFVVIRKR